jgi:predicted nucleic acid-binding protein
MKALYLETSVILSVLFRELGFEKHLEKMTSAERWISSRLTQVEMERAMLRRALDYPDFEKLLPDLRREARAFYGKMDFIEIGVAVCELAGRISPHSRLRSLDAIHLATYRMLRSQSDKIEMLSSDDRILKEV